MKKFTFGLIATVISLSPITAFAQDSQTVIQDNSNNAAAVGVGNYIQQGTLQNINQNQFGVDGYYTGTPSAQTGVQVNSSEAAAVGAGNYIDQTTLQNANQTNVDLNGYFHY